jgi:rsbT antagonist protein RsbS
MPFRGSIPILRIGDDLLVSLQVELRDRIADAFQEDVLVALERSGAGGLVLDISALEIVDSYVARILVDTGKMAGLMGAETVVAGMRPEVAATLVRMGFGFEGIQTALNLDEGLALLARRKASRRG